MSISAVQWPCYTLFDRLQSLAISIEAKNSINNSSEHSNCPVIHRKFPSLMQNSKRKLYKFNWKCHPRCERNYHKASERPIRRTLSWLAAKAKRQLIHSYCLWTSKHLTKVTSIMGTSLFWRPIIESHGVWYFSAPSWNDLQAFQKHARVLGSTLVIAKVACINCRDKIMNALPSEPPSKESPSQGETGLWASFKSQLKSQTQYRFSFP
jgi:hypothetical protein